MNSKAKGEKAQRIVIGELAKLDIDVAIPLSDNLPWDFIIIYDGLQKIQVKSSGDNRKEHTVEFKIQSTNWHKKTRKTYTEEDCDAIICYDSIDENIYILGKEDFVGRSSFTIRKTTIEGRGKQIKNANMHNDYILSKNRLDKIFAT